MFPMQTKDLVDLLRDILVVTLMTRISNQINDMQLPLKKIKDGTMNQLKRKKLKHGE